MLIFNIYPTYYLFGIINHRIGDDIIKKIKKRKKRLRLKTSFKRFLVYLFVFILIGIYTFKEIKVINAELAYKESYEYKLIDHGYTKEEAILLDKNLNDKDKDYILSKRHKDIYYNIAKEKYFIKENFQNYLEYKDHYKNTSYEDTIAIVNVKVDHGFYNKIVKTDTSKNYLMLVNKNHVLDESYKNNNLVNVSLAYSYANNKLDKLVLEQFNKMYDDIKSMLNVNLMITSSYKSYNDVFENHKKIEDRYGYRRADDLAPRAGHDDRETGFSFTLSSLEHSNNFKESEEFKWLKENSYKYGFIIRYPESKGNITGYENMENYFRYVGTEVASIIYKEQITFDEYYAYYIEK